MNTELSLLSLEKSSVYFLGIGGSGMYGVASLATDMGIRVVGCDEKEGKNTARLRTRGIPFLQEEEAIPEDVGAVVYSLAVSPGHPRLCEARARELPLFDRAAFLGLLMQSFSTRIAVAGSHGKSSTTAMCAAILSAAGHSPTVLSGAELNREEGSYRRGEESILLFEACEYRDSFLSFSPTHALVLSASWEHTDYFPNRESVLCSFDKFLHLESVHMSVAPFGELHADVTFGKGGEFYAENVRHSGEGSCFFLCRAGRVLGEVSLSVLGAFQVENAVAAAALCASLGVDEGAILRGLCSYRGIPRRMERCGSLRGMPLYLDFAHHPKELFCALRCASLLARPLAVVFEPHTYSRTKSFFDDYVRALRMPHMAGVLPIYPARETDTLGVSSVLLAREAGVAFLSDYLHAARFLTRAAGKGCTLLLVGAGGVEGVLAHLPFLIP